MLKNKKMGYALLIILMIGMTLVGCIDSEEILADTQVEDVDLRQVEDGKYKGEYTAGETLVIVEVEVKNHEIKNIDILKHQKGLGGKAEVIVEDVIEKQTLKVDVVSGATVSSKVILKATENALRKGIK